MFTGEIKKLSYFFLLLILMSVLVLLPLKQGPEVLLADAVNDREDGDLPANYKKPGINDIEAESYIVIDLNTGNTVLEYNSNKIIHPASLTKILTAIIGLEKIGVNDVITASPYAGSLSRNESKIGLIEGEMMPFKDMLYGLMLSSGNDAAIAIAEHVSGNILEFSYLMREKSVEIGAKSSNWANPSGITDFEHTTTSFDLAQITRYAYTNPVFREVVNTDYYSLPATNKHPFNDWNLLQNTNRLMLFQNSFFGLERIYSVGGVKTGTTVAAGSNLIVTAHVHNGLELISVINGVNEANSGYIWSYTVALLEEAAKLENGVLPLLQEGETIEVDGLEVLPGRSFSLFDNKLELEDKYSDNISFELDQDNKMVLVYLEKDLIYEGTYRTPQEDISDLVSGADEKTNVNSSGDKDKSGDDPEPASKQEGLIIILIVLVLILIILVIALLIKKNKSNQTVYRRRRRRQLFFLFIF